MDVLKQIGSAKIVSPRTRQRLVLTPDGQWLECADKSERYRMLDGKIPILLLDPKWADAYAGGSERMSREYTPGQVKKSGSFLKRLRSKLIGDYRTRTSIAAFTRIFEGLSADPLCVSVGGGPMRIHPFLTNLNIGPFENVDVVGDAHALPYADGSVDAIYCEAVIEHLSDPGRAASEIHRVLKPGGKAYICTPFLQEYHGYPYHYQNYTLTGHKHLLETAGLRVLEAGTCVGPVYAIFNLISVFIYEYLPAPLNRFVRFFWRAIGVLIRPLDLVVAGKSNAFVLASTTYVLAEKVV